MRALWWIASAIWFALWAYRIAIGDADSTECFASAAACYALARIEGMEKGGA